MRRAMRQGTQNNSKHVHSESGCCSSINCKKEFDLRRGPFFRPSVRLKSRKSGGKLRVSVNDKKKCIRTVSDDEVVSSDVSAQYLFYYLHANKRS